MSPPRGQKTDTIFWFLETKKTIFQYIWSQYRKFRFWPLRGQGGQNVTSNMSKWKIDAIFVFLDPENLYFDTHEANIVNFRFRPLRGQGGQNLTFRRSKWKSNAIFEILDPKNIFFDIHDENKPNFNFDLFEVKEVNMTSGRSDRFKTSKGIKKNFPKLSRPYF